MAATFLSRLSRLRNITQSGLAFLVFLAVPVSARQITTVVGTGLAGYTGDGGPAASATINQPQGIAFDDAGNLYIADALNYVVRKVDAVTGAITTVAGNGVQGFGGDGGAATQAMLGGPIGIYATFSGHIFIADQGNQRIRLVDRTLGIISTVAGTGAIGFSGDGGLATNAKLNFPQGVAMDSDGNIYIADTTNLRLRKVAAATGFITTIAGTGFPSSTGDGGLATAATLTSPRRVTVDLADNIYILDRAANARIRRIDKVTGIITRVAGGGMAVADSGLATDLNLGTITDVAMDGVDLIVTSTFRTWRVSQGIAVAIAGTGAQGYGGDGGDPRLAVFNNLSGAAVSGTGEVFVSDRSNNRIRKISPGFVGCDEAPSVSARQITTVAGTGVAGYAGNGGPATSATINGPQGISFDGAGNLYIADNLNYVIRKVNAVTGNISTVAGNGVQGFSGDDGLATNAMLSSPVGIFSTPFGDVLIADQSNQRIRRVDGSFGSISTVAGTGVAGFSGDGGPPTSARINAPQGVALDGSIGSIYIADTGNCRLRWVDVYDENIHTIAGTGYAASTGDGGLAVNATFASPRRVAIDPEGNIYVLDAAANARVRRIDAATGIIRRVAGGGTAVADSGLATDMNLGTITDIAIDGDCNLIVTSSFRVWRVAGGMAVAIAGTGAQGYGGDGGDPKLAVFDNISGAVVNEAGEIFLSDRSNNRIRKIGAAPVGSVEPPTDLVPQMLTIEPFPNPVHASATIGFQLPQADFVRLDVFDVSGRLVRNLLAGTMQAAGRHEVRWNGTDGTGRPVRSGMYYLRVASAGRSRTQRLAFLR